MACVRLIYTVHASTRINMHQQAAPCEEKRVAWDGHGGKACTHIHTRSMSKQSAGKRPCCDAHAGCGQEALLWCASRVQARGPATMRMQGADWEQEQGLVGTGIQRIQARAPGGIQHCSLWWRRKQLPCLACMCTFPAVSISTQLGFFL